MKKVLSFLVAVIFLFTFSSSVLAQDESTRLNLRENMKVKLSSPSSSPVEVQNRENVRERVKNMLEGKKLQACKAREEAIKTRKKSLLKLATESLKRMDGWVEKLKKFYEEKLLANGKKIDNYSNLLAEIERTRADAVSSLDKASALADEFKCDGDNPKEVYKEYRQAMQEVKTKLFEYRKAVKSLLVAIRNAGVIKTSPVASPEAR